MANRMAMGRHDDQRRPLVITSDPALLDDLLRVAAAAGAVPEVAEDAAAARRFWHTAPLVIVGADAAAFLRGEGLPARSGVVLVQPAKHNAPARGPESPAHEDHAPLPEHDGPALHSGLAIGAATVLTLPADEAQLSGRLADTAEGSTEPAPLVCVLGGCGGAGASTFAAALAVAATVQRLRPTLVDADPLGGGIDLLMGGEAVEGLRWSALASARGRISGPALRAALPHVASVPILSCDSYRPIPGEAMAAVVDAARRVSDLVIADLPRRVDAAAVEALTRASVGFVVIPAEVRAAAAATRVVADAGATTPDLRAVVRRPVRSMLTADVIARHVGLPLAGEYRRERGIELAAAHGEPPGRNRHGPLASLCHELLLDVIRPSAELPT